MNQLLTVDTRFGTSTALFNTIHKRLITVMCGDEDVTASLLEWERNSLQQDLANGHGYTQTFKAARVVSAGFGTFIFPLHGRDCESRRFEMATQIASWMAETRPHQDSDYQVSAAVRAVENSERFTNVVYEAGHDQFKIILNGRTLGKTRLKSDIIILAGK
ncbi:TPA: hypothetical protein ACTYQH_003717 [Klebsiella michiganensis]|uniref:hypothetical protein n=1 Tax=Klebsiella michiganensis TaxID=1134687 RepID=UPI00254D224E|nr:hypothetical protein [Klebsiella michiganensis]MDK9842070.1 hypothetical protein [Klebsiella michiganensis]